jgi:TrmH family RNA methyltransferase
MEERRTPRRDDDRRDRPFGPPRPPRRDGFGPPRGNFGPRREGFGPRRDDRGPPRPSFRRDDGPRDDRPREDRPRYGPPRDDRPRDDRPRFERPRDDRPRFPRERDGGFDGPPRRPGPPRDNFGPRRESYGPPRREGFGPRRDDRGPRRDFDNRRDGPPPRMAAPADAAHPDSGEGAPAPTKAEPTLKIALTRRGPYPALSLTKLKMLRSLESKKGREANDAILAEGVRVIRDGIASGAELLVLVIEETALLDGAPEHTAPLKELAKAAGENAFLCDAKAFAAVSDTVNSQGVVAAFRLPKPATLADALAAVPRDKHASVLVVDSLRDPGNLGTILRNAGAFGCALTILTTGCADPHAPKTVRASMGGVFVVPVVAGGYPADIAAAIKEAGLSLYPLDSDPSKPGIWPPPAVQNPVFVLGGETQGLSKTWIEHAGQVIHIPQSRQIDSLNAAVASAVVLSRWFEGTALPK